MTLANSLSLSLVEDPRQLSLLLLANICKTEKWEQNIKNVEKKVNFRQEKTWEGVSKV